MNVSKYITDYLNNQGIFRTLEDPRFNRDKETRELRDQILSFFERNDRLPTELESFTILEQIIFSEKLEKNSQTGEFNV